jgi:anti-sigma regulatory factor (Ser/Thr protein kinase)
MLSMRAVPSRESGMNVPSRPTAQSAVAHSRDNHPNEPTIQTAELAAIATTSREHVGPMADESPTRLRFPLQRTLAAPREARLFAVDAVRDRFSAQRAFEFALVVGELTNNAVTHGEEPIELTLGTCPTGVRVEVHDASPGMPAFIEPHPRGGRGLLLVHRLSDRWGAESQPGDGKLVWAEFDDEDPAPHT